MVVRVASEIEAHEFAAFFGLILYVIKLVQFARPVWHIEFQLMGIFQHIHGKEFFPEISSVQFYSKNGFIKVLQFPQGKFLGKKAETQGMFLHPFLQPFMTDIQYLLMVKCHIHIRTELMPVQFIVVFLQAGAVVY